MTRSRTRITLAALALTLIALAPPNDRAAAQTDGDLPTVRRFLLTVGNNDGGSERARLQYAATDAQGVLKVFSELGGVDPADCVLLLESDTVAFRRALSDLRQRIVSAAPAHSRVELILYYSGHSDERGLMLGPELLSYAELRSAIDALPADVRIIILDSCASGAFTRLKGGQRRPPFLVDASAKTKGHAFLTSSSHDEAAQESDRIRGSYFTHALVTGLRGAADVTLDRRVSLNEAYQYAFATTLARTEGTRSGAQHPGYDIQMVGAGDLVMTDLRELTAGLVLEKEMQGRVHVRDAGDVLVVEVQKPAGRRIELGLEPGDYRIFLDHDGRYFTAALTLDEAGLRRLTDRDLLPMSAELTAARGEFPATALPPAGGNVLYRDFSASLWPGLSTNGTDEEQTISEISLNLSLGRNRGVNGFEGGGVANWNLGDVTGLQLAGGLNLVEGDVRAVQLAGLVNRVHGQGQGVQWSGFINSIGGAFDGLQWGALNLIGGPFQGLQWGGLGNVATGETFVGAQSAGLANAAEVVTGLQSAGLGNHCRAFTGAQVAGLGNHAGEMNGLQLAVINVAGAGEGSQIGVVNVARTLSGAQIGVINLARELDGAPIGVINLIEHGRQGGAIWSSEIGHLAGIELGSQRLHSILAGGFESFGDDRRYAGFGFGLHQPLASRLFGTTDLISWYILNDDEISPAARRDTDLHLLHQFRLGLGWQLAPRLAIIGGGVINGFTSRRNDGGWLGGHTWRAEFDGETWTRFWPGFYLGLRI